MVVAALVLALKAGAAARRREPSMMQRAKAFVQERPLSAGAAALAAGFFAIRSPKTLMSILLALLEPKGGRRY